MKLAIDISQIAFEGTGVARFTRGLIAAICANDTSNNWTFYYSSLKTQPPEVVISTIQKTHHRYVRNYFPPSALTFLHNKLHAIPFELMIGEPVDWYISSDWTQASARARKATIVHDMVFHRYPETVAPVIKEAQRSRLQWAQRECEVIFCDSESTRKDLESYITVPNAQLVTNWPGVTQSTTPTSQHIDEVLKKHVITKPYILAVGKLEPRKNLHRLIAAFLRLYREDIDLVIVGQAGWDVSIQQLVSQASKEANVEVATRQLTIASNNIRFLGYIPDDELTALYRGATCFAFPSIWEGFGYPVVEAMQQEVPICCSNTSSIAEIAKDVAVFFDPGDVHDITRALHETLRLTPEARMKRTNAGFKRAEEFSWAKYYKTMIDALRI